MLHTNELAAPAGASDKTEPAGRVIGRRWGDMIEAGGDRTDGPRLLTTAEVLQRLRVSRRTLACWIDRGLLPVIKLPGSRRLLWDWGSVHSALLRHQRGAGL
jgi:excisionase family DNA binding protein